jgi:hypothetical protein
MGTGGGCPLIQHAGPILIYINPTFLPFHQTLPLVPSSRNTSRCLLNSFIGFAVHSIILPLLVSQPSPSVPGVQSQCSSTLKKT